MNPPEVLTIIARELGLDDPVMLPPCNATLRGWRGCHMVDIHYTPSGVFMHYFCTRDLCWSRLSYAWSDPGMIAGLRAALAGGDPPPG